jgi:hypothetical protein
MGQIADPEIRIAFAVCKGTRPLGVEDERVLALPDSNGGGHD